MLSASSLGPYIPDIPMHPSAIADTRGPPVPSCVVFIELLQDTGSASRTTVISYRENTPWRLI
jgi:hypothetical protein